MGGVYVSGAFGLDVVVRFVGRGFPWGLIMKIVLVTGYERTMDESVVSLAVES